MSAPLLLSNSEIASIALCSIKELEEPVFTPRQVSPQEKQFMIENAAEVDVDFLMINENCAKMIQHNAITALFGDLNVHFFQVPEKKKVYSCSLKYALVFAKIGNYFVSTPFSSGSESQNETEALFSQDCDIKLTDDWSTSVAFQMLDQKLSVMRQKFNPGDPFATFRNLLLEYLADFNIVIYRFGQKVPLGDLQVKIYALVHDAKLRVEIAFGKELSLPGFFVAHQFQKEFIKYSYSAFLSNNLCNVRIDDPAVCQSFAAQSYHFVNYNTFHHAEKNINWVLQRESGNRESSLLPFKNSFNSLLQALKAITDKLDDFKSRVEIYYSISSIGELIEAKSSLVEVVKNSI